MCGRFSPSIAAARFELENTCALYFRRSPYHCLAAGIRVVLHAGRLHPHSAGRRHHFDSRAGNPGQATLIGGSRIAALKHIFFYV